MEHDIGRHTGGSGQVAADFAQRLEHRVGRALLAHDALRADAYGGLSFGPGARPLLKGGETLELVLPPKRARRTRRNRAANPEGDPLFEALRARRRDLAKEAGVPPYVIFHDSTLREMAELKPTSLHALSRIAGVGAAKLDRYGAAFVEVIEGFAN